MAPAFTSAVRICPEGDVLRRSWLSRHRQAAPLTGSHGWDELMDHILTCGVCSELPLLPLLTGLQDSSSSLFPPGSRIQLSMNVEIRGQKRTT